MRRILSVLLLLGLCLTPAVCPADPAPDRTVDATLAFPVGPSRDVFIGGDSLRELVFANENPPARLKAYIVGGSAAHVRIQLSAHDNPFDMVCHDGNGLWLHELPSLLNARRDAYVLDVPMADGQDGPFLTRIFLSDRSGGDADIRVFLLSDEAGVDGLCRDLEPEGWVLTGIRDTVPAAPPVPPAYVLHVTDQHGAPVPGAIAAFCTDTACTPVQADEEGVITFDGEPGEYHVQLLSVPGGCSFDPDFELMTGSTRVEWLVRVRRDGT